MRNGTVIEDEVKKTVGSSHAESYGHCKDFDFYSEGGWEASKVGFEQWPVMI